MSETTVVYWHRNLPPINSELIAEHTLEATSGRVSGALTHHDQLWDECYGDLMATTERRLRQEIARLGGDLAHVLSESIDVRHDDAAEQGWLHGRFSYVLYRAHREAAD
jgi:hypothetical protein